jgi:hypothetical protein
MGIRDQKKWRLGTPANIVASAFNLPVMVIAGLIVGTLLSSSFSSPTSEFVIIGTTLIFFIIAMVELYVVVRHQTRKERLSRLNQGENLRKLILEDQEKDEE